MKMTKNEKAPVVCKILRLVAVFSVIILLGSFVMTGCTTKHKIYEQGFFKYIYVGENSRFPNKENAAVIAIIGFTESGLEQEVIDFPKVIKGKPVRFIGYGPIAQIGYGSGDYYVSSPNLKKAYIYDNIISASTLSFDGDLMVCTARDDHSGVLSGHFKNAYFYREIYDRVYKEEIDRLIEETMNGGNVYRINIFPANIEFLNNYSNEVNGGYYRLDNIEQGEKVTRPPSPVRNGYEFTGWFTEPGCENIWDFDNMPEIEEDKEFKLYAGWRQK